MGMEKGETAQMAIERLERQLADANLQIQELQKQLTYFPALKECSAAHERRANAAEAQIQEQGASYQREIREWYAKLQGADANWAEAEERAKNAERLVDEIRKTALPFLERMRVAWDSDHYEKMLGPLEIVLRLRERPKGDGITDDTKAVQAAIERGDFPPRAPAKTSKNDWVAGEWTNGYGKHDMIVGPCCCGAKHKPGDAETSELSQEVLPPLAKPSQCGEWTEWGQCVADKPCKVHPKSAEKPKNSTEPKDPEADAFLLTSGQDRFIAKLSKQIPKPFLLLKLSDQIRVGGIFDIMGKKGVFKILFWDRRTGRPEDFSPVVAWEDGSITVGGALLNFLR